MKRYTGKCALITGAGGGLGLALVQRLASEGASLLLSDMPGSPGLSRAFELAHQSSVNAGFGEAVHNMIGCDVADPESIERALAEATGQGRRLDAVFCLAGIQKFTPSHELNHQMIQRVLDVTLNGTLLFNLAAIRYFRSRPGGGVIVNCSSVHERIPKPGLLSYAIAKAGVAMLTRTLALEYVREGIRINAVGPGAVDTPINDAWRKDAASRQLVEDRIPAGRVGTPEEMAGIFAFLGSSEAEYIVGQTIYACGGLTLYGDFRENWSS